jgi:phosphoglucosamine mutase
MKENLQKCSLDDPDMSDNKRFFGTDGIRGRVGGETINPEFVLKLGWAAGKVMSSDGCAQVVIGKDTRISGYMFESALEAGFSAAGVDVLLSGPIPTPAVAYLTRTLHACAGVVISASHNPHHDNGIKFFDAHGHKVTDEVELAIEAMMDQPMVTAASEHLGKAHRIDNADARYIEACKATVSPELSLHGLKIVVDCAHGAAYHIAPDIFREMGAEVIPLGVNPDGLNINLESGATHLPPLQQAVVANHADLGIALDGDADRIMMVDESGAIVDGDQILYIIARDRLRAGTMKGPVVGTLMSNLGLEKAITAMGLTFIREGVGDRYVMQRLRQEQGILGGESSGHVICLDRTTTGDGLVAALQVLSAMVEEGASLHSLSEGMQLYPQVMINVPASRILKAHDLSAATELVEAAENELNGNGRILLRPSGTEPLVRVMVEGPDERLIEKVAGNLAKNVAAVL